MISQLDRNKSVLQKYIPEPAVHPIALWIVQFDFKLKIKRGRSSKYGDYRPPIKKLNHQITINRDMNRYAFLITLVHEIAHLTNWNKFKHAVKPHGHEWKQEFKLLMRPFMNETIFPDDVMQALSKYMQNPAASSCSDVHLMRILKRYDDKPDVLLLEELSINTIFKTSTNRYFIKGEKRRTRFLCKELRTKRQYLFSGLAEVYKTEIPMN
jgi:SprT protein